MGELGNLKEKGAMKSYSRKNRATYALHKNGRKRQLLGSQI